MILHRSMVKTRANAYPREAPVRQVDHGKWAETLWLLTVDPQKAVTDYFTSSQRLEREVEERVAYHMLDSSRC